MSIDVVFSFNVFFKNLAFNFSSLSLRYVFISFVFGTLLIQMTFRLRYVDIVLRRINIKNLQFSC